MSDKTSIVRGMVQSDINLDGKTVLITGANSGVGYETALDLAGRVARVIMACRNMEKAEEAKAKILEEHKEADVVVRKLDLASLESIREFAKITLENEARLDILINNAGIMMCPHWKTKDGFEMQFGTNHIGHFLLTQLLLDLIKKSAPSRIIIVSSLGYRRGRMNWDDIMSEENYDPIAVYRKSKLANVHHCLELSRRLEGSGVTCNCLHPGLVATNLGQFLNGAKMHFSFKWRAILAVVWPVLRAASITSKKGAQTSIYCAIAPELAEVSGKYYSDCAEERLQQHALNREDAEKLWKMTENWIKQDKQEQV